MQNYATYVMEKIQSNSKNSSLKGELTWRDIQGLSWTLEDDFSFEYNDKISTYACA